MLELEGGFKVSGGATTVVQNNEKSNATITAVQNNVKSDANITVVQNNGKSKATIIAMCYHNYHCSAE